MHRGKERLWLGRSGWIVRFFIPRTLLSLWPVGEHAKGRDGFFTLTALLVTALVAMLPLFCRPVFAAKWWTCTRGGASLRPWDRRWWWRWIAIAKCSLPWNGGCVHNMFDQRYVPESSSGLGENLWPLISQCSLSIFDRRESVVKWETLKKISQSRSSCMEHTTTWIRVRRCKPRGRTSLLLTTRIAGTARLDGRWMEACEAMDGSYSSARAS